jgi:hypothetical protein
MKVFRPGTNIHSDYCSVCDNCETDDGRPTLVWNKLADREGHFVLCLECVTKLFFENNELGIESPIIDRQHIPEWLRNKIFDRDYNKCLLCGTDKNISVDHIIPFSKGGRTIETNLQTLCRSCNSKKKDKEVVNGKTN